MGKRAQITSSPKIAGTFAPIARTIPAEALSAQKWRQDLLVSWLFQTCIRLRTSLDRRFLSFGLTLQEASALIRCVEARRITPGRLAVILGRDKGNITRLIDRLDSSGLLTRDIDRCDRRVSILRPTAKGKRVARDLASVFDKIRKELFTGILESDVGRLSQTLSRLHKNAARIGAQRRVRRRVGITVVKCQCKKISQPQVAADALTHQLNRRAGNTVAVEFL
jgi:DNA-binding MarR family transcriptional regulator